MSSCPRCGFAFVPDVPARTLVPLTPIQASIVCFIERSVRTHGYAPSFQEIADHFGYQSLATVHEHLTTLVRKGWLRKQYNEVRSLEVLAVPNGAA